MKDWTRFTSLVHITGTQLFQCLSDASLSGEFSCPETSLQQGFFSPKQIGDKEYQPLEKHKNKLNYVFASSARRNKMNVCVHAQTGQGPTVYSMLTRTETYCHS